jgi:hypothetical protein
VQQAERGREVTGNKTGVRITWHDEDGHDIAMFTVMVDGDVMGKPFRMEYFRTIRTGDCAPITVLSDERHPEPEWVCDL